MASWRHRTGLQTALFTRVAPETAPSCSTVRVPLGGFAREARIAVGRCRGGFDLPLSAYADTESDDKYLAQSQTLDRRVQVRRLPADVQFPQVVGRILDLDQQTSASTRLSPL